MNELRVISGLHRGAAMPLDGETVVVGSSFESDLLLADPGIAEQHAVFTSSKKLPNGCWHLKVVDKNVWNSEGKRLSGELVAKVSMCFNVGGVWLSIAEENAPWPDADVEPDIGKKTASARPEMAHYGYAIKGGCVAVGVLLGAVTFSYAGGDRYDGELAHASLSGSEFVSQKPEKIAVTDELSTVSEKHLSNDDATRILKRMIRERRLGDISIHAHGEGLALKGEAEADKIALVERMIQRFYRQNGKNITIENLVVELKNELPFDIVKVVSGPYGYVETRDGARLQVGSEYKGFKLVGINASTIKFGGRHDMEVKW